jgi:Na+:H+ antiporter, NhaA family
MRGHLLIDGRGTTPATPRHRSMGGARNWRQALPALSSFVGEHLLLLPLGALVALTWVNVGPAELYYRFAFAAAFAVNSVAMVFFFGYVAKEVVESTAPGGVCHPWRRAALPVIASAGGLLAAGAVYVDTLSVADEPMLARAWPTLFGSDLAFAYVAARLVFGRHPAVPFVLLLSLAANAFGFIGLAIFYPARDPHVLAAVALMAAALTLAGGLRRARVKSFWPYVLGGGTLSWLALYAGGFHPALALLPIVPFLPHAARDPGFFVDARPGARDALSRFELWARHPAQAALFLFALVNAGVAVRAVEAGAWALPVAVLAGKPLGILAVSAVAVAAGLHLPHRVGWREILVGGLASGIGFTLALFFAGAALAPGQLLTDARMGALLTVAGLPLAVAAGALLRVGRFAR